MCCGFRTFFFAAVVATLPAVSMAGEVQPPLAFPYSITIAPAPEGVRKLAVDLNPPQKIIAVDTSDTFFELKDIVKSFKLLSVPPVKLMETLEPADKITIGGVATGKGNIADSYLAEETTEYASKILGTRALGKTLVVVLKKGGAVRYTLPQGIVFENSIPVVIDLKNDGLEEIVVTETSVQTGQSSLVLYAPVAGKLRRLAASKPIENNNEAVKKRWVAPLGAMVTGENGEQSISAIDSPDVNGFLNFYQLQQGEMILVRREYGYSHHVVGTPYSTLYVIADFTGDGVPELFLPRNSLDAISVLKFENGVMTKIEEIDLPTRLASSFYTAYTDKKQVDKMAFFLADGQIALLSRLQVKQ